MRIGLRTTFFYCNDPNLLLHCLAWIGKTLTANLTAVRSIYLSLQDLRPINAWRVFRVMNDNDHDPLPTFDNESPLLTELASAKIFERLNIPIGWPDLILHQIELYIRVMGQGNTSINSRQLVSQHRVKCPPFWQLPDLTAETELQLLNCSVWQLETQLDQEDEDNRMWTLALALINNPQPPTGLLAILDRLFTVVNSWLDHSERLNDRRNKCLRKLVKEFILPAIRNQQVGNLRERLAGLDVFQSVLLRFHLLQGRPDVANILGWGQHEWTEFFTAFEVVQEDDTLDHTPASIRLP